MTETKRTAGPLEGIRILDLTSVVLGPMTAQYLGDMGADVIKIEALEGDIARTVGPRRSDRMAALFLATNRNKRSVVINLQSPAGQAILRKMVASCDVLLHSIRTGSAERIGISYGALSPLNPRLIYCHVTGFSDAGAYAGRPAYDDIIQALSGLARLQTVIAGEPRYVPSIVADKITAVHAAYAIALALFHRANTGLGQEVVVPMFETMVAFNAIEHLGGSIFEPPVGKMGYEPVLKGMRRPFKTRDGYLCVLPYTDMNWRRFFEIVARPDLAADPRFGTQAGRQRNLEIVLRELGAQLATRTNADWLPLLQAADIPSAVVNDLEDLLVDPHLESIGFWKLVEHPSEGMLRLPGIAIGMSGATPAIGRPPPRLGEHTREVLRTFDYDDAEIEQLAAGGVVALGEPPSGGPDA